MSSELTAKKKERVMSEEKPSVTLVSITPDAEATMAYCARVSSPNQENPEYAKLLSYCIKQGHWSVFEMANMVLEVNTSRAIAQQLLRHRSFTFQEFSQRYAKVEQKPFFYPARRQDEKNRQNSIDDLPRDVKDWFHRAQEGQWAVAQLMYEQALKMGIAKEQARFLLPLSTPSRLYVNGTVRSWIHYIQSRTDPATQLEHRLVAEGCKRVFCEQLPTVAKALEWTSAS